MSANPIDDNPTPKTTGSLEELFRHHLGEAAAVPPRPMLWDQIDNSLLMRQNEAYRRRLTATRWVAAASLLLATLAGTGWWAGRTGIVGQPETAAVKLPAANIARRDNPGPAASTGSARPMARGSATSPANAPTTAGAAVAAESGNASSAGAIRRDAAPAAAFRTVPAGSGNAVAVGRAADKAARRYSGFGPGAGRRAARVAQAAGDENNDRVRKGSVASRADDVADAAALAARRAPAPTNSPLFGGTSDAAAGRESAAALPPSATLAAASSSAATTGAAANLPTLAATADAAASEAVSGLDTRLSDLRLAAATALPSGLATVAVPMEEPTDTDAHRWHYGASYAAGLFNPNVNFSRAGIDPAHDYNPALGADSPALTEAAATQYRQNLRPGLSQRLAVMASRHLRGHWSWSTGAEFTQATATSSSSVAFVGEQIPDLGQSSTGPLHTTDFRYRMASIPVEIRYTNPVKRGWSLYGRLGGVVTALLGVRSDVEGNPEATRTYSITSAGTPYRRVLGSLRGGAGAQFRASTGQWALTLGPVTELGLVPLNAHPAQNYLAQSHPYSVGLEAGLEFGR